MQPSTENNKRIATFTNDLGESIRRARSILVCVGAGISVNAGIPDFRSPQSGIYSRIGDAEEIFHIENYQVDPIPFYKLCVEMFDFDIARIRPTPTHMFIKHLGDSGKLLRCYTQNIDGLELKAGLRINQDVIQCHGNLDKVVCSECRRSAPVSPDDWKQAVRDFVRLGTEDPQRIPSQLKCTNCGGFLKPSVVMFGEPLPSGFISQIQTDIQCCDLVLIIGTSLTVFPFAAIPRMVHPDVPQYSISRGLAPGKTSIDADCDFILSIVSSQIYLYLCWYFCL